MRVFVAADSRQRRRLAMTWRLYSSPASGPLSVLSRCAHFSSRVRASIGRSALRSSACSSSAMPCSVGSGKMDVCTALGGGFARKLLGNRVLFFFVTGEHGARALNYLEPLSNPSWTPEPLPKAVRRGGLPAGASAASRLWARPLRAFVRRRRLKLSFYRFQCDRFPCPNFLSCCLDDSPELWVRAQRQRLPVHFSERNQRSHGSILVREDHCILVRSFGELQERL